MSPPFSALLLLPLFLLLRPSAADTFIVHMDSSLKPSVFPTHDAWYLSTLSLSDPSPSSSSSSSSLLYSYSAAFHGFSTSSAATLRNHPSVLSLYPDPRLSLHTTRTTLFLGLPDPDVELSGDVVTSGAKEDVIVGGLDNGVWPESRSFDDAGLGAVPGKWKGVCETGPGFPAKSCNRKLIGARYFSKGYKMASETHSHSQHSRRFPVANASLLGYARGTARGMATRARIATYKVCWSTGCFGSDILAGIDRV